MSTTPRQNVSLAPYTTLNIGGAAEYFVTVTTEPELAQAVAWANVRMLPVTVMGGGSNVLVADAGISGVTVRIAIPGINVEAETATTVRVTVGAGEDLDTFIASCVERGWWGLENLSHIPGTVGATPVQNVGAYGVEMAEYIQTVRVYDQVAEKWLTLSAADCCFGYRTSIFKQPAGKRYIVTFVTFALQTQPAPRLTYADLQPLAETGTPTQSAIREAVIAIRGTKFPDWHTLGTAGSFFKNPTITAEQAVALQEQYPQLPTYPLPDGQVKVALGWVLDSVLGYRGYREGCVGTYEGQALVLINHGGATAAEVVDFATMLTDAVQAKTGLVVDWEVTYVM